MQFLLRIHDQSLPHVASAGVGVIGGYLIENLRDVDLGEKFYRIGWILFSAVPLALFSG